MPERAVHPVDTDMNEVRQPTDRREVMLRNVRSAAREQASAEFRENYFRSCEAHGGEIVEIVAIVRAEFPLTNDGNPINSTL